MEEMLQDKRYNSSEYFAALRVRVNETDVSFEPSAVRFNQGHGFLEVKNKEETRIAYSDITKVEPKRRFIIPDAVISGIIILFGLILLNFIVILIGAASLALGTTGVLRITRASGSTYDVPTGNKADAQELQGLLEKASGKKLA